MDVSGFTLPGWMTIDGVLLSRPELLRARPAWWWSKRTRQAWQDFRTRLIVLAEQVERGWVQPRFCYAEVRLYLEGDEWALETARVVTSAALNAKMTAALLGIKVLPPKRIAA